MKFTKNFILTMSNFASINKSMYFEKGTVQTTALFSSNKTGKFSLFARANTDVEIDSPFAIIDLPNFINTIGIFGSDIPKAKLSETHIHFSDTNRQVNYKLTNPDFIKRESNIERIKVAPTNLSFNVTKENLQTLKEIYSLFKLEQISIRGSNGIVTMTAEGTSGGSNGGVTIGTTEEEFNAIIKTSNLILYKGMDYNLKVVRKGYVHLSNDIFEYFIPCEKDSDL